MTGDALKESAHRGPSSELGCGGLQCGCRHVCLMQEVPYGGSASVGPAVPPFRLVRTDLIITLPKCIVPERLYNPGMRWIAQPRVFLSLGVVLIAVSMLRSSWATQLDGFTIDEPWHITAGAAYLRTGEYYLNPEHPPLVKLVAALALPSGAFRFAAPLKLNDKNTERNFVQDTMYEHNDADAVQERVRRVIYLFNGLLLLGFAWATCADWCETEKTTR